MNIKNYIMYRHDFDVRGSLVLNASLDYNVETSTDESKKSLNPSLSSNLTYRLWNTLSFKSLYVIMVDDQNKTTNHTLNSGLYYKYRKLISYKLILNDLMEYYIGYISYRLAVKSTHKGNQLFPKLKPLFYVNLRYNFKFT